MSAGAVAVKGYQFSIARSLLDGGPQTCQLLRNVRKNYGIFDSLTGVGQHS